MIQQLKKNSLLQAILGLISLSTATLAIAENNAQGNNVQSEQQDSASNAYAANYAKGEQFYQQYYLTPQQLAASTQQGNIKPSTLCSGTWVTPIGQNSKAASDPSQTTSIIGADKGYYDPAGTSFLEGNVTIDQDGRSIRADKVQLDNTQTYAKAEGNVQLAQGGLFSKSEAITYNLKDQTGDLKDSFYISEQQQAHGYATQIKRTGANTVELENASFSTCEPSASPAWRIQAKTIELNQETGRGITKDARLYIKDVPVLPIPYFNFPIDDRRTTGFLTPSFGYTNDGGIQLSVPYYLNLAPNYDLTATPRYLGGRGVMIEGDFRYLTESFGAGNLWGGYLPSDQRYDNEDRKELHLQHLWQIDPQWRTTLDLNYVSDKDYFTDLGNSPNSQDQVYQERTWALYYANGIPGITAQLKVQDFQTLDKSIADVERPYARLPQFIFQYQGGDFTGLSYSFLNDSAYFKKSLDNPTAEIAEKNPSGTRIYNEASVNYNFRTPGIFVTPTLTARSINTFFDQDTTNTVTDSVNSNSIEKSVAVPQFTLDAGMIFEKEGSVLQTLSPRIFYAYAPYKNQSSFPNFDSASASLSYDQLFSPYRFYGHDRLEDNNFASLGLTYRLYDQIGLERLRASIGQSYYFADRRVQLNETDQVATSSRTGPVVTVSSQLSNTINVVGNAAWLSNGKSALNNVSLNYADEKGRLYNLGYYHRREVSDQGQQPYQQVATSFIQPINNNWRILGHVQYDLDNDLTREVLVGLNYESCCWGISVYGRSYYNDLDDPTASDISPKRAVMAEFSLKGLGGLSGKLTSLLENRVIGFDHVNQNWTQR